MSASWKEWNRNDIIYGIIVPILVVLLISIRRNFVQGCGR